MNRPYSTPTVNVSDVLSGLMLARVNVILVLLRHETQGADIV